MFETGMRQLRMALSMVGGRRIDPRNVERLIDDALATLATFGSPGDDMQQLLDGPVRRPGGPSRRSRSRRCGAPRDGWRGARRTTARRSPRAGSTRAASRSRTCRSSR